MASRQSKWRKPRHIRHRRRTTRDRRQISPCRRCSSAMRRSSRFSQSLSHTKITQRTSPSPMATENRREKIPSHSAASYRWTRHRKRKTAQVKYRRRHVNKSCRRRQTRRMPRVQQTKSIYLLPSQCACCSLQFLRQFVYFAPSFLFIRTHHFASYRFRSNEFILFCDSRQSRGGGWQVRLHGDVVGGFNLRLECSINIRSFEMNLLREWEYSETFCGVNQLRFTTFFTLVHFTWFGFTSPLGKS